MEIYYINYLLIISIYFLLKIKSLSNLENTLYYAICFYFIIFVGARYEVGGDWFVYLKNFNNIDVDNFSALITSRNEIGYSLFSYLIKFFGLNFFYFNLSLSIIVITSVFYFVKKNINPFFGLIIIYPLFIVVFSMGFVRQAIACSLILISIYNLENKKIFRYYFFVLLAASFHISALLFIIIHSIIKISNLKFNLKEALQALIIILIMIIIFYFAYNTLIIKNLVYAYLKGGRDAIQYDYPAGAIVRIFIAISPAFLYILIRNYVFDDPYKRKLYLILSCLCIFISLFFIQFPVFVDRYLYYFIFLQIIIFGRFPHLFLNKNLRNSFEYIIIAYYLIIFLVWINYADHIRWWIPYSTFTNNV